MAFVSGTEVGHPKEIPNGCMSTWVPKYPREIKTDKTYIMKSPPSGICPCVLCGKARKLRI